MKKNKLLIISPLLIRDHLKPMSYFRRLEVLAAYSSEKQEDLKGYESGVRLVKFRKFSELEKIIREFNPDIIQGVEPYWFPEGTLLSLRIFLLCRKLAKPFFISVLENKRPGEKFFIFSPLFRALLKKEGKGALFLFAANRGAARNLTSCGIPEDRIERELWGVWGCDLNEFRPGENGGGGRKNILFAGRLGYSKGFRYFLDIIPALLGHDPAAGIVIAGAGRYGEEAAALAAGSGGRVVYHGFVENIRMPEIFRTAYLTVAPSVSHRLWEEQVGMVNMQSLASGVPVVSTLTGAIPEIVTHGETGLLVPERDSGALFGAVAKLLDDPDLRDRFSKNARNDALLRFDVGKNVKKTEDMLIRRLSGDEDTL